MTRRVKVELRSQFYNGQGHMGLPQEQIKDDTTPMRSTRGRMPSGKPNPVDVHVGARVRLRRTLLGMSQEKLGEAIGLTFQQVQKYERGANRIGASRLWDLSRVLDCPMSFFFEEMDDETASSSPRNLSGDSRDLEPRDNDPMTKRETLELVRAYYRINDYHVRRRIYELAKSLASTEEPVES
jgi:transcriptional regulator with XRE-family HTH domain